MYNPETIQTDFVINLDKVASWLKITKSDLLRTLQQSYKLDIDFTISKAKRKMVETTTSWSC